MFKTRTGGKYTKIQKDAGRKTKFKGSGMKLFQFETTYGTIWLAGFDAKDARGGRKDLGKVLSVKKI